MKISVKVKPNSRQESVEKVSDTEYIVRVKAPPKEGKANEAVVKLLCEYFKMPRSMVTILHGQSGKNKIVEIY